MRWLYSIVLYLMLPLALLRLWFRGRRVPGYRRNLKERFGFVAAAPVQPVIWFHAVSVGEVRAAQPLVNAVLERYPDFSVLVTTATPTGRETAQQVFGNAVGHHYMPYDLPASVRRFLQLVQPVMVVILETEIWPNLYSRLEKKSIPLLLVNARLSQQSLRGYLRLRALSRSALHSVWHIAAQSEQDAQRFRRLGARAAQLSVMGNLKFEMQLPDDFSVRVRVLRDS
ncbi:MAG: 3-deoxy-D-manno-octulosonic acid transferase, partial [Thiogranum sp.]